MVLTIEVIGSADDAADLANLNHVFRTDDALRQVDIRLVSRPGDNGVMGPVTEAIVAALGGGGIGAVLLQTVGEWLRSRKSDVSVRLTSAKASVEISVSSVDAPDKVDKILRQLEID
jgi:hypothetical protein